MKEPKELQFEFQEVNLQQAEHIVAAGDGKYSNLVLGLSEKLQQYEKMNLELPADKQKTMAFGLPKGMDLTEKERKGMMMSLMGRLKRLDLYWSIRYSSAQQLFFCVPPKRRKAAAAPPVSRNGRGVNRTFQERAELKAKVIALREQGLTVRRAAEQLGVPYGSAHSLIYGQPPSGIAQNQRAVKARAENLVAFAREALNFHGPFVKGQGHPECVRFRTAAANVLMKDMGLPGRISDEVLGFKNGGSSWMVHHPNPEHVPAIAALRQAIKEKGIEL